MSLQALIENYGYLAVFVGCFVEGETVLVLAGFAAHLGYISFPGVVGTAALAGFFGDEAAYFAGRRWGGALVARFRRLREAQPLVRQQLERYGVALVFFVRFLIGLRMAAPVAIGASRALTPLRFAIPNAAGAIVWALAIGSAGYLFGAAFTGWFEHARLYEEAAFVVLAVVGAAAILWRRRAVRRRARGVIAPPR